MATVRDEPRGRNNNFFALILIGIGVFWLLGQANILSGASFAILARVWPVLLIALGINILIARNSPGLSFMVGAVTILMLLALMIVGPALGWVSAPEVRQESLSEPLDGANRAEVRLDLSVGSAEVRAVEDSNDLITADIRYLGDLRLDMSGTDTRFVHLYNQNPTSTSFSIPFWDWDNDPARLSWNVQLTTAIPLDLQVSGGVGDSTLDLTGIQLTNLDISTGVGGMNIVLPEGQYNTHISGGVGQTDIRIEDGAALNITVNAGVGGTTITLPDDAAVQLQATGGLGGVSVPSSLEHISGERDAGVWRTANYEDAPADERITITYSGGVGGLTLR